ncbi:MAG: ExsB family transcriptional regulator, partial [Candidatus Omnitrophica bacterium]|nr:ExsB family transcriptional regulator [Candidatus Omnitrophota bacterium]
EIRKEAGNKGALVATSGGVDSMVCAVLAHKALGRKAVILFIDDGLMRISDEKRVRGELKPFGIKVNIVRVADDFFKALKGKVDPEEKRKAFRNLFYRTLGKAVRKSRVECLIQGTIAADIIETKGKIKTQHNILEQIGIDPKKHFGFTVVEPLREIFKYQVRKVAKELGFSPVVHQQMPFPGPGLATRVVGEVTPQKVKILRKAVEIVEEEMKRLKPFQAFAVLLNDKATGIRKGKRLFGNIIAIRSVESNDAMTASITKIPWPILEKIRERIIKEITEVVKVVYDITPKPPSTIEYI